MENHQVAIDHIDPRWEEGRDYQLVCGLDCDLNYCERSESLNVSKSNRFLPYRGRAPVNPGDMCHFLDPSTNEWVYEEFMGLWWYEKTRNLCGPGQPATENQKKVASETMRGRKVSQESRDKMSQSHTGMKKPWMKQRNQVLNSQEYQCLFCDRIIRSKGNLIRHIKSNHPSTTFFG